MSTAWPAALAAAILLAACETRATHLNTLPAGSVISIDRRDGRTVTGTLLEAGPERVLIQEREGSTVDLSRNEISKVRLHGAGLGATMKTSARGDIALPEPEYRAITIPANTALPVVLTTSVASDGSRPEDRVEAKVRRPLVVDGRVAVPAGARLVGSIAEAERSGKVKGRARISFRFHTLRIGEEEYPIRTLLVARRAPGTKKADALKVGAPAAAGAVIGGVAGGKKGAAIGGAVGGGAGTAVVLTTRGKEVRFGPGAHFTATLTESVTVRAAESSSSLQQR